MSFKNGLGFLPLHRGSGRRAKAPWAVDAARDLLSVRIDFAKRDRRAVSGLCGS